MIFSPTEVRVIESI